MVTFNRKHFWIAQQEDKASSEHNPMLPSFSASSFLPNFASTDFSGAKWQRPNLAACLILHQNGRNSLLNSEQRMQTCKGWFGWNLLWRHNPLNSAILVPANPIDSGPLTTCSDRAVYSLGLNCILQSLFGLKWVNWAERGLASNAKCPLQGNQRATN